MIDTIHKEAWQSLFRLWYIKVRICGVNQIYLKEKKKCANI